MYHYEHLGKPLQIGKLTVKNRFCMAQELSGCGAVVYEIGDGQEVSTILHAVWDGYEVGNNI